MELEVIYSAGISALLFIMLLSFAGTLVSFCFFLLSMFESKVALTVLVSSAVVMLSSGIVSFNMSYDYEDKMDAQFASQLASGYNASSSRSFEEIQDDFSNDNEAGTIFIRNGVETPVIISKLGEDSKTIKMEFKGTAEQPFYPKVAQ